MMSLHQPERSYESRRFRRQFFLRARQPRLEVRPRAAARVSTVASSNLRPIIWRSTGSPSAPRPMASEVAGAAEDRPSATALLQARVRQSPLSEPTGQNPALPGARNQLMVKLTPRALLTLSDIPRAVYLPGAARAIEHPAAGPQTVRSQVTRVSMDCPGFTTRGGCPGSLAGQGMARLAGDQTIAPLDVMTSTLGSLKQALSG